MLKDGLNSSGRLQKYIMKWFVIPFTKVVDPETLMKFFEAKNLEEQRLLFKQLPLQEIKEAFRYIFIFTRIKLLILFGIKINIQ